MTDKIRDEDEERPARRSFWQWFLLYPTFGVAVVSAAPGLADKALATYHQTGTATYSGAVKQFEMWTKNAECTKGPVAWYDSPRKVKLDATLCDSGDLFVRAVTPDNRTVYHWVPLEEMIAPPEAAGGLIPAAHAAPAAPVRLAMLQSGEVICQRQVNGNTLVRRIRTPQGCYDEFVNMYTGQVVERRPAACAPC
ncbi:MAG TPA: hypothetical protein VF718_09940 [Allosphingosinicella sp.]